MKKVYLSYATLLLIILIIELIYYFSFNSNLFGIIYIILNFISLFFLSLTAYNYNKKNTNLRISKSALIVIIMIFSIAILPKFNYIDESYAFIEKIKLFINIIKPLIIIILLVISALDFKFIYKRNNKIN